MERTCWPLRSPGSWVVWAKEAVVKMLLSGSPPSTGVGGEEVSGLPAHPECPGLAPLPRGSRSLADSAARALKPIAGEAALTASRADSRRGVFIGVGGAYFIFIFISSPFLAISR